MNRAERRRAKKAGIPVKKEPVVNIKAADVQKIKQDASKEAADKAFLLMLGLPVMVLHDKFGFGPVRCERFTPNSDTGKGTLYINGEPLAEVGEIKIPLEVEPSDLPPILANVSFTITMDCPRWLRRKLAWWIFKARLKDLIHRIFHF